MTLPRISPEEAHHLHQAGARLIDVRERDEHARIRVPGAQNLPLNQLDTLVPGPAVIFHCRSGNRTTVHAAQLAASCDGAGYLLDGGLDAWRRAGLPVEQPSGAPLELMRQVQITAGLLILTGIALGFLVAPQWFGVAAFVGAGLTFAGISGWCGMARLLALMPWNRQAL